MNFYLFLILGSSIFLSGLAAIIRFNKINKRFYPFIFFIWAGCVNEIISLLMIFNGHNTSINGNLYVLTASLLLLWFFKKQHAFSETWKYYWLFGLLLVIWLADTFIYGSLRSDSIYFRICYSLLVVFLSINLINQKIFSNTRLLFKDASFLIYISFCFYFTYKALIEAFIIYGIRSDSNFLLNIYIIMLYTNFGINLIYFIAVLWMPRKHRFTKPLLSQY